MPNPRQTEVEGEPTPLNENGLAAVGRGFVCARITRDEADRISYALRLEYGNNDALAEYFYTLAFPSSQDNSHDQG